MNMNPTTQFDLSNARNCAMWSSLAYASGPASQNIRTYLTAPDTNTRVLVTEQDDGSIIIAFRGTANIRNWLTDADCVRATLIESAEFGTCKVHAGFLAAYESIITPLTVHLREIMGRDALAVDDRQQFRDAHEPSSALWAADDRQQSPTPVGEGTSRAIYVTGHSLGGALALLAALELKRQGFNIAQVYTFGQPRVGNAAFKRLYEKSLGDRTYRLVYREDIVPRVPLLPAWSDPYRHAAGEVFLSALGDIETNPSLTRVLTSDVVGLYRVYRASRLTGTLDPVLDHHIENYLESLKANG